MQMQNYLALALAYSVGPEASWAVLQAQVLEQEQSRWARMAGGEE